MEESVTLAALPMELIVLIFSFVISVRDRVKLRYVSQRVRAAVETPNLWKDFTWPHFDFREECSINNVLKSCGAHIKKLSFPHLVVCSAVQSLIQHCTNLVYLSLPSVKLSFNQLTAIMQSMRNLYCLDTLWTSKSEIRQLLLVVGCPIHGNAIKELTIREQVKDSSFQEAFHFLLSEWVALHLMPHTLNVVTKTEKKDVLDTIVNWAIPRKRTDSYTGYLNMYKHIKNAVDLHTAFPFIQFHMGVLHYIAARKFINSVNCGLLGLEDKCFVVTDQTVSNGEVLHKAKMIEKRYHYSTCLFKCDVEFLTHFSAFSCDYFYSGHLEQLAIACPNLQQLDLAMNINCLKNLQGLSAIASCQKLQGLSIDGISVEQVESSVRLWEILIDLQLTNLSIEL